MNTKSKLATLFLSYILFASCEKVIEVDINSNDQQIVVEAEINDDTLMPAVVRLSKSLNYNQDVAYPAVTGAKITITDNLGNSTTLTETKSGLYTSNSLIGKSGRTYNLSILVEGKTITASCRMPTKVYLDSLSISEGIGFGPPTASGKSVVPIFNDPKGRGNYYRFVLSNGAKVASNIFILDDQVLDGSKNSRSISSPDIKLDVKDTITVRMLCISKEVHFYFNSLTQNGSGPDASGSPANPKTNLAVAKLGYFSANTSQTMSIIVK